MFVAKNGKLVPLPKWRPPPIKPIEEGATVLNFHENKRKRSQHATIRLLSASPERHNSDHNQQQSCFRRVEQASTQTESWQHVNLREPHQKHERIYLDDGEQQSQPHPQPATQFVRYIVVGGGSSSPSPERATAEANSCQRTGVEKSTARSSVSLTSAPSAGRSVVSTRQHSSLATSTSTSHSLSCCNCGLGRPPEDIITASGRSSCHGSSSNSLSLPNSSEFVQFLEPARPYTAVVARGKASCPVPPSRLQQRSISTSNSTAPSLSPSLSDRRSIDVDLQCNEHRNHSELDQKEVFSSASPECEQDPKEGGGRDCSSRSVSQTLQQQQQQQARRSLSCAIVEIQEIADTAPSVVDIIHFSRTHATSTDLAQSDVAAVLPEAKPNSNEGNTESGHVVEGNADEKGEEGKAFELFATHERASTLTQILRGEGVRSLPVSPAANMQVPASTCVSSSSSSPLVVDVSQQFKSIQDGRSFMRRREECPVQQHVKQQLQPHHEQLQPQHEPQKEEEEFGISHDFLFSAINGLMVDQSTPATPLPLLVRRAAVALRTSLASSPSSLILDKEEKTTGMHTLMKYLLQPPSAKVSKALLSLLHTSGIATASIIGLAVVIPADKFSRIAAKCLPSFLLSLRAIRNVANEAAVPENVTNEKPHSRPLEVVVDFAVAFFACSVVATLRRQLKVMGCSTSGPNLGVAVKEALCRDLSSALN